jgi:hypothetical protein
VGGPNDKPDCSAAQTDYLDLAENMRGHLRRLAAAKEMTPGDLRFLIDSAQQLRWFELCAETYDGDLEEQRGRARRGCE